MNKLLNKTLKTFTIYALIVLAASVPAYYYLVDSIWLRELDEHNEIIADRIEAELNRLELSENELNTALTLWNKIQPGTNLEKTNLDLNRTDSTYTVLRRNLYVEYEDINRFRGLSRVIEINRKNYLVTIETNVEETEETVIAIAILTFLFFLILVIGFLIFNRRLSVKLWQPFRSTLNKLKAFNLNSQASIPFEKSNTLEFEELNLALSKLIEHTISVYKSQKEFTENASHELQTPLAIIKNKLDLLLQKEALTDRQYQIIEATNKAVTRVSRINKNLLLLAKIENHQFEDSEEINLSDLTTQSLVHLHEHIESKALILQSEIDGELSITGNKTLLEILLNNLILNAIRHNAQKGIIKITLDKSGLTLSNSGNKALDIESLFKRFKKSSDESSGSGLGLAIVEQICKRHHWTINYLFKDDFHIFKVSF
ncbi:MAG: HAMP domain-containing histidine kinase [Flammeovirgaceae bacterium]|nr:HAMP domain-containing histidine kinase [Flammeovirgaceae bacterium]